MSKLDEVKERLGNVKAAKRLYNINEIMMKAKKNKEREEKTAAAKKGTADKNNKD